MVDLNDVRRRHIKLMDKTGETVGHVISQISQVEAALWRDGPEGWTVLEVLGHLLDFEQIFHRRAVMMVEQDTPQLPGYDHDALVVEGKFNEKALDTVYQDFMKARAAFMSFFQNLDESEWEKSGIHPERDQFTMTDAVIQAGHHAADHLEQITRIIRDKQPA